VTQSKIRNHLNNVSLNLVLQPYRSPLCGQSVVAMLLGVSLDKGCGLVGHRKKTRTREIVKALRSAGWIVPDRRVVISSKRLPTDPCLVNVQWTKDPTRRHWTVLWDGEIYCSIGLPTEWYKQHEGTAVKSMSFLPLTPPQRLGGNDGPKETGATRSLATGQ